MLGVGGVSLSASSLPVCELLRDLLLLAQRLFLSRGLLFIDLLARLLQVQQRPRRLVLGDVVLLLVAVVFLQLAHTMSGRIPGQVHASHPDREDTENAGGVVCSAAGSRGIPAKITAQE